MALAESRVTTRRSLPVGIFSVAVAIVLVVIAVIWFRFGTSRTSVIWVALAALEIVIAIFMLRPITFHVTVDEDGVRNEGHSPWSIDRASIANGGVIAAKHPTLWVRPVKEAGLKRSQGYTESTVAPERSYLVPVRRSQAENLARALASMGLEAGRKAGPDEINKNGAFRFGSAMGLTGVAAGGARALDAGATEVLGAATRAAAPAGPERAAAPTPTAGVTGPGRADGAGGGTIEATEPIGWPPPAHSGGPAGAGGRIAGSEPIGWPVGARRATPEEDAAWLYGDKAGSTVITLGGAAPRAASRAQGPAAGEPAASRTAQIEAIRRPDAGPDRPRRAALEGADDGLEDDRPTRPMRAITDDMTREEVFGAGSESSR